ncbi:MAG: alkaline phosphatase [Bacteroidetes bacterium]|nr:alkaline phosphatase [Bacteroidota bacterium]
MPNNGFTRRDFLKTGALSTLALGGHITGANSRNHPAPSSYGDAKNIIFLVSDGMSAGTMALADLVKQDQFGTKTNWIKLYESDHTFHRGLMDMATLDSTVPDSAAAASSWGSGKRINNNAVNWGPTGETHKPICEIFRDAGKATGLVTTTRITHATPAGFAANVPSRDMEDEIAAQYANRQYDVLLGGGRRHFTSERRSDNVDLLAKFRSNNYTIVNSRSELQNAPVNTKLLGLFHDTHLPYMVDYNSDSAYQESVPTLAEKTTAALQRLANHENGFILQVEGGRVDHAAHANDAASLVYEQIAFDEVIQTVLEFTEGRNDTLVILTTDHGNANPGLVGLGSGYRNSPSLMKSLYNYRQSLEWVYAELGYHWTMPSIDTVTSNKVRDVVEYATNTVITPAQADMITHAFKGEFRAPFGDRQAPASVIAGVLANYNGIYFIGTNHTADFVEIAAWGPGSERIPAFVRNTDIFELMVDMADVRAYAG